MTEENKKLLERINAYAQKALGDIDPQKVRISYQLEQLRPVMEEIARERQMPLEDVFILYMDLTSEASVALNNKLKEDMAELADGGRPIRFR